MGADKYVSGAPEFDHLAWPFTHLRKLSVVLTLNEFAPFLCRPSVHLSSWLLPSRADQAGFDRWLCSVSRRAERCDWTEPRRLCCRGCT
eukprot:6189274-Pleurochrysis_carterae.AAC.2